MEQFNFYFYIAIFAAILITATILIFKHFKNQEIKNWKKFDIVTLVFDKKYSTDAQKNEWFKNPTYKMQFLLISWSADSVILLSENDTSTLIYEKVGNIDQNLSYPIRKKVKEVNDFQKTLDKKAAVFVDYSPLLTFNQRLVLNKQEIPVNVDIEHQNEDQLRVALEQALKEENYVLAAKIRDRLEKL